MIALKREKPQQMLRFFSFMLLLLTKDVAYFVLIIMKTAFNDLNLIINHSID